MTKRAEFTQNRKWPTNETDKYTHWAQNCDKEYLMLDFSIKKTNRAPLRHLGQPPGTQTSFGGPKKCKNGSKRILRWTKKHPLDLLRTTPGTQTSFGEARPELKRVPGEPCVASRGPKAKKYEKTTIFPDPTVEGKWSKKHQKSWSKSVQQSHGETSDVSLRGR